MPAVGSDVAEIINAAWRIRIKLDDWEVPGVMGRDRKIRILNDLVFKSFEVLEWSERPPGGLNDFK